MAVLFTNHGGPLPPKNTHLNGLLSKAQMILQNGLANSTKATYRAGRRRYMRFCKVAGKMPIPTSECTLTLFTTHLATHKISFATIKVYLSAVCHMHLCKGLHDHFNQQFTPGFNSSWEALKRGKHAFALSDSAYLLPSKCSSESDTYCQVEHPRTPIPHSGLCVVLLSSAF